MDAPFSRVVVDLQAESFVELLSMGVSGACQGSGEAAGVFERAFEFVGGHSADGAAAHPRPRAVVCAATSRQDLRFLEERRARLEDSQDRRFRSSRTGPRSAARRTPGASHSRAAASANLAGTGLVSRDPHSAAGSEVRLCALFTGIYTGVMAGIPVARAPSVILVS